MALGRKRKYLGFVSNLGNSWVFGVRSEVLFGEQIKDITEPSEIAMANTGAHTGTRNNPHIRSRGLLKNCSKRPIRSIENFESSNFMLSKCPFA